MSKRVLLLRCALLSTVAMLGTGCSTIDKLKLVGDQPPLSPVDNPTTKPGYKPVQMPMPTPQPVTYNPNSLWRNGSRAFFKDQRAHQVGDIMTVKVNINDTAQFQDQTQTTHTATEDSGITNFIGANTIVNPAKAVLPGRLLSADSNSQSNANGSINRQDQFGDECRRGGHATIAERKSGDRGQAGNPAQLRSPRTHRRRRRASGGHRQRQQYRICPRSPRPASRTAAAASSPIFSRRVTASRCWTSCCRSDREPDVGDQ